MGAAVDFLQSLDHEAVHAHEVALLEYGTQRLSAIEGLTLIGTAPEKSSLISFILKGVHPHDLGTVLDEDGVAVRTGHHCAMPVMDLYRIPATVRASFSLYNTCGEIDVLAQSLERARKIFT
jgi:cysteine desulfurase/selenocysteine lyase